MKLLAAAVIGVCVALPFGALAEFSGKVAGHGGLRILDQDDWSPNDRQFAFGISADFAFADAPIYLSPALIVSTDSDDSSGTELTLSVATLSASLKFKPRHGVIRPWFGVGLASVGVARESDGSGGNFDEDDQSFGLLTQIGLEVQATTFLVFGLQLDYLDRTNLEFSTFEADVNGPAFTAYAGYSW